jgi:hypothetical protein
MCPQVADLRCIAEPEKAADLVSLKLRVTVPIALRQLPLFAIQVMSEVIRKSYFVSAIDIINPVLRCC